MAVPGGPQMMHGTRIIDVGHVLAGPMASSFLADFGADVIHIDAPAPEGTWADVVINRNKRYITLDMRRPEATEIFHRLAGSADAVTENFRPDRMDSWGHDWATLHRINPRLVYLRLSGFGQTGPYSGRRAYGMIGEAFSGWSWLNGFPDGPPMHSSFSWGDTLAAQYGAMAIVMALYHRDAVGGGQGQLIDLGLVEPLFRQIEQQVIVTDQTGVAPRRDGTSHEDNPYAGVCRTADGEWFSFTAITRETIAALVTAFGLNEMTEFADPDSCRLHRAEFKRRVSDWFAARSLADVSAVFERSGACGTKVMNAADLMADEHVRARDMVVSVPSASAGGEVIMQGVVPKFSATPGAVRLAGCRPGQHNDEIYAGLLGMSRREIAQLHDGGVI